MADAYSMGGTIGGAAIGGLFGLANQALAHKYAEQDRASNFFWNEKAADAADARTRALYEDFYAPEALLKQYQEAGVSPSLMFGGTPGQGGQSGAMGHGAGGIQTPFIPIDIMQGAQIGLMTAQARKTNAEADAIIKKTPGEVEKLFTEAGLNKAALAYTESQTKYQELINYVTDKSKEYTIYTAMQKADEAAAMAEKTWHECEIAKANEEITVATVDIEIKKREKELDQIVQNLVESNSRVTLNEENKKYLQNEIENHLSELTIKYAELDIKDRQQTTYEDWINAQIPVIEKQLDVKLAELGIEKKKLVINAITDTLKAVAMSAMAASAAMNRGGGVKNVGVTTPPSAPSEPYD